MAHLGRWRFYKGDCLNGTDDGRRAVINSYKFFIVYIWNFFKIIILFVLDRISGSCALNYKLLVD
jgi:hypothetical protein